MSFFIIQLVMRLNVTVQIFCLFVKFEKLLSVFEVSSVTNVLILIIFLKSYLKERVLTNISGIQRILVILVMKERRK